MRSIRSGMLVAAAALAAAGCSRHAEPKPAASEPAGPPLEVATAEVVRRGDAGERLVPAIVQARERATLMARIPASIVELPVRVGDRVEAGALLVRLDDAALRAVLAAAESEAQAAEAELKRSQTLHAKGAATDRELEDARARAAAARAAVSGAKDSISYAVLRAPFAGRVAERPASLGDVAAPGRPLIELESEAGLEVVASLESDIVGSVRPGLVLQVQVDGLADPLRAVVRAVSASGDPATHRFEVKADLPRAADLRAGLFARLALPVASTEARLLLPTRALVRRGGLVGAYVVSEGRARLRWIAAGEPEGVWTEVRAGLDAGERVVLEPPASLFDGAAVSERAGGLGGATQHPPAH